MSYEYIKDFNFKINDVNYIPNFDYVKYNRLNMIFVDFLQDDLENLHEIVNNFHPIS